jgi:hypothetical protein
MSDRPDEELIRELYAMFGLAYYQSECLHRGLCIAFTYLGLPEATHLTRPRVEELLAQAFSLTLGEVADKLKEILPDQWSADLTEGVEARNFLAHHFWFDRAHLMHSGKDVQLLIAELQDYAKMFDELDVRISEWPNLKEKEQQLGLSAEKLEYGLMKVLAGEDKEPLPDKKTVRELDRKLRKQQRLIRVWEPALGEGHSSLIFELVDGTLWQLSEVGLGWTRLEKPGLGWKENEAIRAHLPADIIPRPQCASPWDYEFTLADSVVLWVKPGRKEKTFRWGLRAPSNRAGMN